MFGPGFRDFVSQDTTSHGQSNPERLIKSWYGFEKPDSEDSGNCSESEGEFEVLDGKSQEIPANPCDTPPENLSLENAILANFPDGCDRSFTVELKDEDSYGIIPKNLTFAEIINILNQAVREDDCEELDKVVQNIEDYEGRSITLDNVNLKSFCEQQLNLDLRDRSGHQHIYSNVLSQYKFDQENSECDYSVKELVLLAIAANNKLTEKYQDILFAEGNLSLLPVLVGGQKYIEAFIEKFHGTDGVYGRLKGQAIQLVEPNKIGFFSVIALRKEQELLETVFVEYVLRDFGQVLKTSKPNPLYGVLETASLIKNEEFITIVLGAFERYINEPTKKASTEELLKKSFATLLETVVSQERISVIEYLCKRYTNSADHAIYDVYEQAFADDKVITILRQQILKNIGARGRKEIYDLILKTALGAGNIAFIERLCKECAECSNDVINYLDHKLKNNEFDETYKSTLVALSNVKNTNTNTNVIVNVLFYTEKIYQNVSHEQVVRQAIRNILRNATRYSTGQEDYSLVKEVCYLYTEEGAINVIFQEECRIFKSSIEKRIEDLEKENKLLQSEALREYNYSYLPGIVNGLAQTAYVAYDEYTKDPKDNKRQENTDLIFSLMQIRNILQFSIDVQKYSCHERQDLWDEMCQTPGTFIIRKRSNNVADELEIPVITSDILSENPGLESAGSQQPQENVDRRENIMNNEEASIEQAVGNDCRGGKIGKRSKQKGVRLLASFVRKKISEIISKGNDNLNLEEEFKDILKNEHHNSVLKYAKSQEVHFKDKVVAFLTPQKSKKNGAQINGKQSTNPSNTVPPVQPTTPETPNASSSENKISEQKDGTQTSTRQQEVFPFYPYMQNGHVLPSGSLNPITEMGNTQNLQSAVLSSQQLAFRNVIEIFNKHGREGFTSLKLVVQEFLRNGISEIQLPTSNGYITLNLNTINKAGSEGLQNIVKVLTDSYKNGALNDRTRNAIETHDDIDDYRLFSEKDPTLTPTPVPTPNPILTSIPGQVPTSVPPVTSESSATLNSPQPSVANNKSEQVNDAQTTTRQQEPNPIPTPTPVPTPNLTPTPNPIPTPTPAPTPGLTPDLTQDPILTPTLVPTPNLTPTPNPVPTPEPVPSVANNKSEQVNDTQTNGGLPNNSGKNNAIPQNTKSSKLPVIAASALAIAGIISGVAVAVYLEMLAVGIAVGAGCLIVAIVTYCYRPKTLIENDKVEKVDDMQKSTPCCS
ncbi:hypothetical protein [Wolbachia endosymbiont (group A) of Brachyopa scutellaris]|uniref:host RNA manipulator TomO n=1 Tax=Wolbachia endosymbiont (group A) of Brachyopa scutellaris TaxID=3066140 RepID=UPI0031333870